MLDAVIKWAVIAAVAAAAIAAVIGLWEHYIGEPYRVQGDVRTETRLQPMIDGLTKQRDEAKAANVAFGDQVRALKASVQAWQDEATKQQARAAKAIADAKADNAVWAGIVDSMNAIIHRPKSTETCEGICARASAILGGIAADGLRQQPVAP